jgi:hypothetical protein
MSRLADILKQEYQTKGIFAGTASALSKRSKEKMDIRNSLFGGSGLGSIIGRKVFGKGYSAISSDKSKVSNISEAISSGSSTILQEISISSKITAKNTLALPSMARDMHLVKQNIIKMVKLQGGTATTKAGDFFSRQSAREAAFENKYSKPTTPTKVEQKKEGGGFLGGLLSILGAVGSVFKSILSPLSSLSGILKGLGLAAVAFGGSIWRILGFLARTRIGKILGLAALAAGAVNAFAGGDDNQIDQSQSPTSPTGNADDGMSFGTKAAIGVAGYGVAKAGITGYGLVKQTGEAISNAKVASNPFVNAAEMATKPKDKWGRFLAWLAQKSPKLFAKFGARLASAGALATIPIAGWIGALISLGLSLLTAYEIYSLWKEFTKEDTKEIPTASTSPTPVPNSQSNDIVQPFNYGGNSPSPATSSAGGGGSYGKLAAMPGQNNMADLIRKKFKEAGFSDVQAEAAVANAWAESRFDPNAHNQRGEDSVGLFQMNRKGGLGKGYSVEQLKDPAFNIGLAIDAAKKSKAFVKAQTIEDAVAAFVNDVERPADKVGEIQKRTAIALKTKPSESGSSVELAQGNASGSGDAAAIMTASASVADGKSGGQSGGGTTNNIAVQAPAQQNQNQQVAMNSPAAFDTDLAKLLMSPMSL